MDKTEKNIQKNNNGKTENTFQFNYHVIHLTVEYTSEQQSCHVFLCVMNQNVKNHSQPLIFYQTLQKTLHHVVK